MLTLNYLDERRDCVVTITTKPFAAKTNDTYQYQGVTASRSLPTIAE